MNTGAARLTPSVENPGEQTTSAEIRIQVARAVRVLVRHGVSAGRASLTDVSTRPLGGGRLLVTSELARAGEGSSKGSYRVYTRSGGAERDQLISRGVSIYNELPRRTVEDTIPASAVRGGVEICVAYRDETAGDGGEEERCVRPG